MALLSIRVKQNIGRVGEVLGWILVLSLVLGPWIAWFIGEPYRHHIVREGELCGPGQRWTYAQPKFADSDLSCEPEWLPYSKLIPPTAGRAADFAFPAGLLLSAPDANDVEFLRKTSKKPGEKQ